MSLRESHSGDIPGTSDFVQIQNQPSYLQQINEAQTANSLLDTHWRMQRQREAAAGGLVVGSSLN